MQDLWLQTNAHEPAGPNGIQPRARKSGPMLLLDCSVIYHQPPEPGAVPADQQLANGVMVFKEGKKEDPANSKPVCWSHSGAL